MNDRQRKRPPTAHPRRLALGAQLGALRGLLRQARLRGLRARVAAQARRRRGAARGPPTSSPASASHEIVDHYEARSASSTSRRADRPLVRRPVRRAPARPRARPRGRRARARRRPRASSMLPFSSLKAASPALAHPSKRHGVVDAHARGVHLRVRRTRSRRGRRAAAYERYAVPETGRIFYEAGFANFHAAPADRGRTSRTTSAAPLLIVGARARTTPSRRRSSKAQYKKYEQLAGADRLPRVRGPAAPARGRRGWEEVAAVDRQLARRRARAPPSRPERMDLELDGKVAVVTGASKGIGLAVARALAAEGAQVVAGARTVDALDGTRAASRRSRSTSPRPDGPDGSSRGRSSDHGRLDVLVNNVGGVRLRLGRLPGRPATRTSSGSLQLNFFTALRATRAAVTRDGRARRRARSSTSPRSTRSSSPTAR